MVVGAGGTCAVLSYQEVGGRGSFQGLWRIEDRLPFGAQGEGVTKSRRG